MPFDTTVKRIRAGLVEADALSRESLGLMLNAQPALEVVMQTDLPEHICAEDAELDLLIFSCRYPSDVFGEGLTLDYWRTRLPTTRLVVLTQTRARSPLATLAGAGIDGYAIRGSVCSSDLITVLTAASAGQQSLCPASQRILQRGARESDLTMREMQVMRSLHESPKASRKALAHRLGMSYHTFNVHVRNISEKLEVFGENAMVRRCMELGWLADCAVNSQHNHRALI
jgi:DNA-binding NarL/FixJ family response regulator